MKNTPTRNSSPTTDGGSNPIRWGIVRRRPPGPLLQPSRSAQSPQSVHAAGDSAFPRPERSPFLGRLERTGTFVPATRRAARPPGLLLRPLPGGIHRLAATEIPRHRNPRPDLGPLLQRLGRSRTAPQHGNDQGLHRLAAFPQLHDDPRSSMAVGNGARACARTSGLPARSPQHDATV